MNHSEIFARMDQLTKEYNELMREHRDNPGWIVHTHYITEMKKCHDALDKIEVDTLSS